MIDIRDNETSFVGIWIARYQGGFSKKVNTNIKMENVSAETCVVK